MTHTVSLQYQRQVTKPLGTRYVDHSWDYQKADTKYFTHGIHPYPAMMIPQVAKRIISENRAGVTTGLDPFCGCGSVVLEFKLAGIDTYGVDINPLAAMVSRVKNTPLPPENLEKEWNALANNCKENSTNSKFETLDFFNIDFWFKKEVIQSLSAIKSAIDQIQEEPVRDFFLVCFSEAVRRSSNTRGGEFKLFRIPEEKLKTYSPDAFKIFSEVVERNLRNMALFYQECKENKTGKVKIVLGDITKPNKIPRKSVDLLVTSPPYGDSKTTVAYGQFSRLSLQWLGFPKEEVSQLDKNMLGGKPSPTLDFNFDSETLQKTVKIIAEKDELRAREVVSFFVDFYKGAREINSMMNDVSKICIVVGNRTVKGINIRSDEIMAEIFGDFGYAHKETIVRQIPSKRMPKINSPSNVRGETVTTMNDENIVILSR